jgi:hypothetical protein
MSSDVANSPLSLVYVFPSCSSDLHELALCPVVAPILTHLLLLHCCRPPKNPAVSVHQENYQWAVADPESQKQLRSTDDSTPRFCGLSRRKFTVLMVLAVLITGGLAIGLGVGLSRSGGGSLPPPPQEPMLNSTSPPPPPPGGQPTAAPTVLDTPSPDAGPPASAAVPELAPEPNPDLPPEPSADAPGAGSGRSFDAEGRLVISPGGGPVTEGQNCTAAADCAVRNSSCIFDWSNGVLRTTGGFCTVGKLADLEECNIFDDCFSGVCSEALGAGAGRVCAPRSGAPCSRGEQCAQICTRPVCFSLGPN